VATAEQPPVSTHFSEKQRICPLVVAPAVIPAPTVPLAPALTPVLAQSPAINPQAVDPVVIINNAIAIATQAYLTIHCNCNGDN
jgi:hypothetical protein